jgi:hypothetical protein
MAERRNLRAIQGGKCPAALVPGVERAVDLMLKTLGTELETLIVAAEHDLDDEDLAARLRDASADVRLARLALAGRREA